MLCQKQNENNSNPIHHCGEGAYMGKAHKNCIIGHKFCLHHITGTAFIIRLKLYVYIVGNSETFPKIYGFIPFK